MPKSLVAKLLLLLYVAVSCRPILPVLADAAAHVLFYNHHYETVHAHNGQFHVHDEVAAATEADSGTTKAPISSKSFSIKDLSTHTAVLAEGFSLSELGDQPHSADFFYAQKQGIGPLEVLTPPPNPGANNLQINQELRSKTGLMERDAS